MAELPYAALTAARCTQPLWRSCTARVSWRSPQFVRAELGCTLGEFADVQISREVEGASPWLQVMSECA